MLWARSHRGRASISAALLAFAIVAILVSIPVPTKAGSARGPDFTRPSAVLTGTVTWNGVDVGTAGTTSSALAIDLSQPANLLYRWSTGGVSTVTISDVRLQMFYFGFAVATRDVYLTNPSASATGQLPLNWTPISISSVLEGVYRLTASMIAPNGTTMWSEDFYVHGTALFGLIAVLPLVLLIIAVYEIYALVRSGRYAELDRKKGAPPPATPTSSPPTTPAAEAPPADTASTTESTTAPDSPGEAPPDSGGSA